MHCKIVRTRFCDAVRASQYLTNHGENQDELAEYTWKIFVGTADLNKEIDACIVMKNYIQNDNHVEFNKWLMDNDKRFLPLFLCKKLDPTQFREGRFCDVYLVNKCVKVIMRLAVAYGAKSVIEALYNWTLPSKGMGYVTKAAVRRVMYRGIDKGIEIIELILKLDERFSWPDFVKTAIKMKCDNIAIRFFREIKDDYQDILHFVAEFGRYDVFETILCIVLDQPELSLCQKDINIVIKAAIKMKCDNVAIRFFRKIKDNHQDILQFAAEYDSLNVLKVGIGVVLGRCELSLRLQDIYLVAKGNDKKGVILVLSNFPYYLYPSLWRIDKEQDWELLYKSCPNVELEQIYNDVVCDSDCFNEFDCKIKSHSRMLILFLAVKMNVDAKNKQYRKLLNFVYELHKGNDDYINALWLLAIIAFLNNSMVVFQEIDWIIFPDVSESLIDAFHDANYF